MGVHGLPSEIASANGRIPSVIKDKQVHIDVNGAYFRLIKARTFSVVEKYASSVARAAAVNHPSMQETPSAPLTASEQTDITATEQIETVDPDSLLTLNAELLEQANTHFSLADKLSQLAYDAAGPLSVVVTKEGKVEDGDHRRSMHFSHIAKELFNQMSKYCDPQAESTILHWDGLPSLQKQKEHQRRQDRQVKDMDVLRSTTTQARIVGGSRRKAAYKKAKNVYRPPLGVIGEIIAELILTYGCNVCFCSYQADTCIARRCAQVVHPEDLFVVSGDSDMIAFKSIPRLIYPLGKHREMTVIEKADLLRVLELPSDNHLLLAAIVAGNDYTSGVPYYGLSRSCDIIRSMDLPLNDIESFRQYVQEYLVRVQREIFARKRTQKNRRRMETQLAVGVEDFEHALRAFVEMTEDPEPNSDQEPNGDPDMAISQMDLDLELSKALDDMPTPMEIDGAPLELTPAPSPNQASSTSALQDTTSHELVVSVLYQLELDKLVRDTALPKQLQPPSLQQPALNPKRRRHRRSKTQKSKQRKKNSKKYATRKKWRQSKYRSRNDSNPRYSAHRVEDPSTASPVDDAALSKMTPSPPRRPTASNNHASDQPSPISSSSSAPSSSASTSPPLSSNSKKKKKKKKKTASSSTPKTRNVDAHPTPALLKDAFKATYKTVTQTAGSIKASLRRGIGSQGVSDEEINIIASRLESAAHLMSDVRGHVFHMLTMLVLDELTRPTMEIEGFQSSDSLDLLLRKAPGTLLIRNLATLVLNGSLGKKTSENVDGIAARELALRTYDRYKEIAHGLRPLNTTSINTADNVMEFGLSVFVPIQTHFKKLPHTIVAKMRKLGWDESKIPRIPGEDKSENADDHSLDHELEDEDEPNEDECSDIQPGHIRTWWSHLLSLPADQRPCFTPHAKLHPPFMQMQERGLKAVLWGKGENPALPIVTRLLSSSDADNMVKARPGELIKLLFYGTRNTGSQNPRIGIKTHLTSYDKHTTTMGSLADSMPQQFGYRALQGFVNRQIAYNRAAAIARDRGVPCLQVPPVFPINNQPSSRYAVNNFIRTNGLELQVLAYDTRSRYQPSFAIDPIMRMEKVLPDHATIMRIFNGQIPKCIGWDPGELVTAALCMIHHAHNWNRQPETNDPAVSNLLIRRSALYSPTTSARADRERVKNRISEARPNEVVTGDLWVREHDPTAVTLRLPSLANMESALPSQEQYTVDEFEEALLVRLTLEPLLREIYSTSRLQKDSWAEKRAKRAELDMAVDAILRLCGPEPCLIAVGNGTFRTGFNLASKHECFKTHFAKKARALGHVVVLVDEYLTSTMCPSCAAHDVPSRVAKPTRRSCVCLECGRWINRDSVGAQNIALIAERWMTDQTRPLPLERPPQALSL